MIIDTHVHIGRILNFNMKKKDVLYSMKKYGIDHCIVSDVRATEFDHSQRPLPNFLQRSQLECIKGAVDFARENPGRISAALWLRPYHETVTDDLCRYIEENRQYIKALKFHPFHSCVPFDGEKMQPFFELARTFSLPVVSHTGGSDNASCVRVYNAAKSNPDISFVMVHMGLGTDNNEAIYLIGRLPNLYGDTSWVPMESTIRFMEKNGDDRIMFGSDSPIDGKDTYWYNSYGQPSMYRKYFGELRRLIPRSSYDKLMYKNAVRLFGIDNK